MTSSAIESTKGWANGSLWDMTRRARITTFIGAGGKTTCLQSLTQEINSYGLQIVATTTTKVFPEGEMNVWRSPNSPPYNQEGACFWYVKAIEEKKWIGPPLEAVDDAIQEDLRLERTDIASKQHGVNTGVDLVNNNASSNVSGTVPSLHNRFWVIEGDGARRRNLKCWGPHEPQIPKHSDCAVLVLDGSLWGRVLQLDQVHRPERCPDLLGHVWQAESAWQYFQRSPVFVSEYEQMSWVILLNCHGANLENKDGFDSLDPSQLLHNLNDRWVEIQEKAEDPEIRPKHLRLAAGDAKEGNLQWLDLW